MWLFILVCFWFKAIVVATLMKTMIQQQYYCHAFKSILHWPSLLRSTSIWEREREREREITTTCWLLFFLVEKEKNIEESWSTVQSCQLMSCRSAACATWEPTCSLSQQQLIVGKKIMNTKICYQQFGLKGRKGVMPQLLTPPTIVDGGNSCSCLAMMIPQVMRDSINFKCLHQLHFINQWAKQSTCCGNTCYAYIPVWNLSGTSYKCKKHTAH